MSLEEQEAKPLKFAAGPRTTATLAFKAGQHAATVRYGDERNIQTGDTLSLRKVNGEEFGTAEVVKVVECKAYEAIPEIRAWQAEYEIGGTDYLMSALNHYYEDTIWPGTEVKVIIYDPSIHVEGDVGRSDGGGG